MSTSAGGSDITAGGGDATVVDAEVAEVARELAEVDARIGELQSWRRHLESKQQRLRQRAAETRTAHLAEYDWETHTFAWSDRLETALRHPFSITSGFRAQQRAAMNASLSGHDVLLVMPTGGGKSLCFQLPAVVEGGVTLVVTPLISLMEDQVLALRRRGVAAELLSAAVPRQEVTRIQNAMTDPSSPMCLLYVTPEKLAKSKRFMTKLQAMHKMKRFRRLAIDEVHCCSQWGHDFRPDYKFLGVLKGMFPNVPIMGLTATSTASVTRDVKKMLRIPEALVFKAPFNRPNLFYKVKAKPASADASVRELVRLITGRYGGQSGIVYTTMIRDAEQLAARLAAAGVAAAAYHARMEAAARSRVHQSWLADKLQVVVATVAFGMGIDKSDVRFVIHHSLSKSLENYYQESGRAGRDGRPADCLLLFRLQDVFSLSSMVFTDAVGGLDNLYAMCGYCLSGRCRRRLLAAHFEERWAPADCAAHCDNCRRSAAVHRRDVTAHARAIGRLLQHAHTADVRLTAPKLVDAWLGRGPPALRLPGLPPAALSRTAAEAVVAHLLMQSYLKEDFHFTPYRTISYLVAGPNAGVYPVHIETVDGALSDEPDTETVDGALSDEPDTETVDGALSDEQPDTETVDGALSDELDTETVDEALSDEPAVEAVDSPSEEPAAVTDKQRRGMVRGSASSAVGGGNGQRNSSVKRRRVEWPDGNRGYLAATAQPDVIVLDP